VGNELVAGGGEDGAADPLGAAPRALRPGFWTIQRKLQLH